MRASGRVMTVSITAMTFHCPVMVGDEITCFCNVERIGNTSITKLKARSDGELATRKPSHGRHFHLRPRRSGRTPSTGCNLN